MRLRSRQISASWKRSSPFQPSLASVLTTILAGAGVVELDLVVEQRSGGSSRSRDDSGRGAHRSSAPGRITSAALMRKIGHARFGRRVGGEQANVAVAALAPISWR